KLPSPVRLLMQHCLQKDPRERLVQMATVCFLLDEHATLASLPTTSSIPAPDTRSRLRHVSERLVWVAIAAVLGVATLSILAARLPRESSGVPPLTRFEIPTPPTAYPLSFALSPDGRQLVYVGTVDRVSRLWLRTFDTVEAQPLAGTENATSPFWSP